MFSTINLIRRNLMKKVAAIQMCSSHDIENNLQEASRLIQEAALNKADLVVLPEMFAIMGLKPTDKVEAKEKFGSGRIQTFLSEQAKKNGIWIVGGTIPIACDNDKKVRAASIVYDDKGIFKARYDKIHLFDVDISETEKYRESDTTEPGNEIVIVDTPVGRLGLGVCYDVRFPELFRYMFNQGVELFSLPSAFTVKTGEAHWELLARSRAVENFCYVIGACQGGTHSSGRKTYGNSVIIDPWGTVSAKVNGIDSGVIYTMIDLANQKKLRSEIPVLNHQTISFDVSGLGTKTHSTDKLESVSAPLKM
jgi:deaminated glutathione amidase